MNIPNTEAFEEPQRQRMRSFKRVGRYAMARSTGRPGMFSTANAGVYRWHDEGVAIGGSHVSVKRGKGCTVDASQDFLRSDRSGLPGMHRLPPHL